MFQSWLVPNTENQITDLQKGGNGKLVLQRPFSSCIIKIPYLKKKNFFIYWLFNFSILNWFNKIYNQKSKRSLFICFVMCLYLLNQKFVCSQATVLISTSSSYESQSNVVFIFYMVVNVNSIDYKIRVDQTLATLRFFCNLLKNSDHQNQNISLIKERCTSLFTKNFKTWHASSYIMNGGIFSIISDRSNRKIHT